MTPSKSLPSRPSLDSLRKQAKKLAHDIAAGDTGAIARARAQLPNVDVALTQRQAQLVLAREYGFAGWPDLTAEVITRLGAGLDWAAAQAQRAIHDHDVDRLKQLLAEYPALLAWHDDDDHAGLVGFATGAYGDASTPQREAWFTRGACAELLIDAGAIVVPAVYDGIVSSRAKRLLELFHRKGLWPRTLKCAAALGDLDAVRTAIDQEGSDLTATSEAFVVACSFAHQPVASLLLDRCIAIDPELGARIDASIGRGAFTGYYLDWGLDLDYSKTGGLWRALTMAEVKRSVRDDYPEAFLRGLEREAWLLGDDCVWFQADLIGVAALTGRQECLAALLDRDPAILHRQPPPPSQAIEFAFTYAHTDLLPLLTRIWPLPDDLPHAAGVGNLARVQQFFDESGALLNGQIDRHYPYNDPRARAHLGWNQPTAQQVLDVALAFAVINCHFDVADFLLARGANIDTNWNSHEPASILHHLVFYGGKASMQYLIERGIDMTIKDYRWNSTAAGWARYGKSDEDMARWLEEQERSCATSPKPEA